MSRIPEPPPILRTVIWCVGLLVVLHGCNVMLTQTVQYLELRDDVGFLPVKRAYHHLPYWKAAFYLHVFSSLFLVFAALSQFLPVRSRWLAALHRRIGKVYICIILLIAAPSGAVLAWHAEGGWIGRTGFMTLSLLWFGTALAGFRTAHKRNIPAHLAWMTRNYALVFSAVTLREWVFWLDLWLPEHTDLFPITAWLGWVPNLIAAELWIYFNRRRRTTNAEWGGATKSH